MDVPASFHGYPNMWRWIVCILFPTVLMAQDAQRYDLVIQEIFADPTPSRGLPSAEFLEIRNRSPKTLNLKNFGVSNGSVSGKIQSGTQLKPDSLLILCSSSSLPLFAGYGNTAVLSPFPAIGNDGDTLVLFSAMGKVLHAVAWNTSWYENAVKEEGGWSLEMKDPLQPWLDKENWTASSNMQGGTPGRRNSVDTPVQDITAPLIRYSYMPDSLTVTTFFSEPPDTSILLHLPRVAPGEEIISASLDPPLFNALSIRFQNVLPERKIYRLTFDDCRDMAQNRSGSLSIAFGRASAPQKSDIIINEILFDPPTDGFDYLELMNRSDKIIQASDLLLANRNTAGRLAAVTKISPAPLPLLPGEYLVATAGGDWLQKKYRLSGNEKMLECPGLPSYPNDAGTAVVMDRQGMILDELAYDARWHFPLISNPEGVSLERIRPDAPTPDPGNWHSASTTSGYGTPGRINSQYIPDRREKSPITLSSPVISPDQDGRDDILLISYHFPQPGNMARVTIFDEIGRPVSILADHILCGTEGQFHWDGLDPMGRKLQDGYYIILTEVFHLSGKTMTYRHPVALVHAR